MKEKIGFFIPLTLGMLTAFGPFITDFYLPSIPEMQNYFDTSASAVAMSLTFGMIGLSLGQILIGPISDKFGRKKLLVMSMILFALSTIGCVFSPNVWIFNSMRVLQGLGGAGGVVLSKSVATDMFTGKKLVDFMAILAAINGVAPILAPVVGGTMTNFTSWRGIFCLLLAIGIILLVCSMRLKETLPIEKRTDKNVIKTYGTLFSVFKNKKFTLSTLSNMTMCFSFFAYITASPFVFQQEYGLTPFQFGLCFGLNAIMIAVGSGLSMKLGSKRKALKIGCVDYFIAAVFVAICQLMHLPVYVLMASYIYMMMCFGLMQPVITAFALDAERHNAGSASAIFGAAGFVAGGLAGPLVSIGGIMVGTSVVIVVGAILCLILTLPLCRRKYTNI